MVKTERGSIIKDVVEKDLQGPCRGDLRIEKFQRSRCSVSGIGEGLFSRPKALFVQPRKAGARHIDLPAHLDRPIRQIDGEGNAPDSLEIGRHIVPLRSVSPGQPPDKAAPFITEGDRHTVDLEFRHKGRGLALEEALRSFPELLQLLPGNRYSRDSSWRPHGEGSEIHQPAPLRPAVWGNRA